MTVLSISGVASGSFQAWPSYRLKSDRRGVVRSKPWHAEARRLREEGLSYDQIAARLGVHRNSAFYACADLPFGRSKVWHAEAKELSATGLTYSEIAKRVNRSIAAVAGVCKGIKPETGWLPGKKMSERDAEAMELLRSGQSLADVARKFGVSRERIRQIAKREHVLAKTSWASVRAKRDAILQALDTHEGDAVQIAERIGVKVSTVRAAASKQRPGALNEIAFLRRAKELAPMIEAVKAGKSYYEASGKDHAIAVRVAAACRRLGITSQAHSRHMDFSHRHKICVRARQLGVSYRAAHYVCTLIEPRETSVGSFYMWCRDNGYALWKRRNSVIGHRNRLRERGILPKRSEGAA